MTEIETLTARAEQGDLEAQHSLAHAYHLGWMGVARNLDLAQHWYQAASSRGHADSALQLGLLHLNELPQRDAEKALSWFERGAALGSHEAAYQVGRMLFQGLGIEPDLHSALDWFVKAARAGFGPALYQLGHMALTGEGGVRANPDKAFDCFRRGAQAGHAQSEFAYARCLLEGTGTAPDRAAAIAALEAAASKGHPLAATLAAQLRLADGDRAAAQALFEQAAMREEPQALFELGRLHTQSGDEMAAMMAYRRAAERGQKEAMLALAAILERGPLGQAPDLAGAQEWRAKAGADPRV